VLKLKHDEPLSSFAFIFSWRRYTAVAERHAHLTAADSAAAAAAGAYTRSLFSST
jgi:hypothetical protein